MPIIEIIRLAIASFEVATRKLNDKPRIYILLYFHYGIPPAENEFYY